MKDCYCTKVRCFNRDGSYDDRVQKRMRRHLYAVPPRGGDYDGYVDLGQYDCNECKHKLACLIDPECSKKFESRA